MMARNLNAGEWIDENNILHGPWENFPLTSIYALVLRREEMAPMTFIDPQELIESEKS